MTAGNLTQVKERQRLRHPRQPARRTEISASAPRLVTAPQCLHAWERRQKIAHKSHRGRKGKKRNEADEAHQANASPKEENEEAGTRQKEMVRTLRSEGTGITLWHGPYFRSLTETFVDSSFAVAPSAAAAGLMINGETTSENGGSTAPLTVICLTRLYEHVDSLTDRCSLLTPGTSSTAVSRCVSGS